MWWRATGRRPMSSVVWTTRATVPARLRARRSRSKGPLSAAGFAEARHVLVRLVHRQREPARHRVIPRGERLERLRQIGPSLLRARPRHLRRPEGAAHQLGTIFDRRPHTDALLLFARAEVRALRDLL